MAEIIDVQMPPDQVVNAVKQMQAAVGRLDGQVTGLNNREFHSPFLKGERAVSRATGSMITNILSAGSASDALALSFAQVERGGRLGLGLAVGVAAGIAAFEGLSKAIQKSHEVHDAAEKALSRPLGVQAALGAAGIGQEFDTTQAAYAAEQVQNKTFSEAILNTGRNAIGFLTKGNPFAQAGSAHAVEDNFDRELELNKRLDDLSRARGKSELAVVEAKKQGLTVSENEAAILKINADAEAKIAALKLNPHGTAGFSDSVKAIREQQQLDVDQVDVKDLVKQEDDRSASDIANFQGTKQEQEDFATSRGKERLQNEIDILHAYGFQEQEKKKLLELDELSGKASEKKAEEAKKKADEDFKSHEELSKAKGDNKVSALQLEGANFQANILKTRQATEQKIAALLKDQKGELAGQAAIAGKLGIIKTLGERLTESPAEAKAREDKERQEKRANDLAEAQLKDAADRERRGAKLDENNPVTQALRAQQEIDKGLGNDKDKGDFSSIASLAGQDFSGLASLGNADFSGLAALAALQLKVI